MRNSTERRRLLRSALKDIGRVFIVAIALDTTYQILVFKYLYILQLLIVAVGCAIVPYVLMRGLVKRLARGTYRKRAFTKSAICDSTQE